MKKLNTEEPVISVEREEEGRQRMLDLGVQLLEIYINDIFIDRRIKIEEDHIPEKVLDALIASRLRENDEILEAMDDDEFFEHYKQQGENLKKKFNEIEEFRREHPFEDEESVLKPFEEMEIKLDAITDAKKAMIISGADPDKLNEAVIMKAKECQARIDGMNEEEFLFEVLMNVMRAQERHMKHVERSKEDE